MLSVTELRAVVTISSWSHTNTASVKGAKMFPWSWGSIDTRNGLWNYWLYNTLFTLLNERTVILVFIKEEVWQACSLNSWKEPHFSEVLCFQSTVLNVLILPPPHPLKQIPTDVKSLKLLKILDCDPLVICYCYQHALCLSSDIPSLDYWAFQIFIQVIYSINTSEFYTKYNDLHEGMEGAFKSNAWFWGEWTQDSHLHG